MSEQCITREEVLAFVSERYWQSTGVITKKIMNSGKTCAWRRLVRSRLLALHEEGLVSAAMPDNEYRWMRVKPLAGRGVTP